MRNSPLFLNIFIPFATVLILTLLIGFGISNWQLSNLRERDITENLTREVKSLGRRLAKRKTQSLHKTNSFIQDLQRGYDDSSTLVTFLDGSGQVLADQVTEPIGSNWKTLPEINQALQNGIGSSVRKLKDGYDYVFVSAAVKVAEQTLIIRLASKIEPVSNWSIFPPGPGICYFLLAIFAGLASLILANRISQPILNLQSATAELSDGKLDTNLPSPNILELRFLTHAIKRLRSMLIQQINEIQRQRKDTDSILSSMREGIIAVDSNERILKINNMTASQFGCSLEVQGKLFSEVFVNSELYDFLCLILETKKPHRVKMKSIDGTDRIFDVEGSPITNDDDSLTGALLVIDDITAISQLDRMRQDFVTNVSHELRTPITAIKSCLETLQNGAMDNPEDSEKFMNMMLRQSNRLHELVEDILSLAKIEKLEELEEHEYAISDYVASIKNTIQLVQTIAEKNDIKIVLDAPEQIKGSFYRELFERAISNLLTNAIKYSRPSSDVTVSVKRDDDTIEISVRDQGVGIPKRHFSRLFERFYRIDQGRTRAQGGTGIGLAIVKHVAQLHRGSISVASEENVGSTFIMKLPRNPDGLALS